MGDLAPVDAPGFALRLPAYVRYTRRAETAEINYDADEFSFGARFEWKWRLARPFVGYFVDGQAKPRTRRLVASREINGEREDRKITETARFQTTFQIEPRRYRHWALGADLVQLGKVPLAPGLTLSVKRLGARWTKGTERGVPSSVSIEGEERDFDTYTGSGAQAVLDAYFKDHFDALTSDTRLMVHTSPLEQTRWQADGEGGLAFKAGPREYTAEGSFRFRWQDPAGDFRSPLQVSRELRGELKLAIPIWGRLKVTPAYVYHRAKIAAERDNVFRFHSLEIRVSLPFALRFGAAGVTLR